MFAKVIVDINHVEVDKIFDYRITTDDVKIGSRVVVPFGKKNIDGVVVDIVEKTDLDEKIVKDIVGVLDGMPIMSDEMLALSNFVSEKYFVTRANSLRLFLPSEMRKGKVREQFKRFIVLNENFNLEEAVNSLKKNAVKQKELLEYMALEKKCGFTEMCAIFGNSAVNGAISKGFLDLEEEKIFRSPYKNLIQDKKNVDLTNAQKDAISSIETTTKQTNLIFGVTGSGKTEVYLNLIEQTISKGKTAIFLVPEIALTPQMLRQLRARFSSLAAILHSGLSSGERFDEWWRLRSGEAKIAIGARSAVFAPLENIGLIIIDEEHDGSYVSESAPRYNTIDIAKFRTNYYGGKVVLGSATPSIESFLLAKNNDYNLVRLPERINKKPLPEIITVDMRKEIRHGNSTPFSGELKTQLKACLDNGNQAILFLNQRGYSKSVICTECGHVIKCDNCDVSLTYHKEDESLLCHYCGAKYKMVSACPKCGSKFIRYGGFGTERVVLELNKLFPNAKISRMDRDTTQNKDQHFKIITDFSEKKSDILVGTQMIAKGHDFPNVTLVGVLDADMSLHFSDFRSGERTFELLTQVAGRSGRAKEAGKVIIQTYSPDNPILSYAFNYDYEGFFEREASLRKATFFPPFCDIVRVMVVGEEEENTLFALKSLYNELNEFHIQNKDQFRFFACMKAPLKKLQGKFRYQILMRILSNNFDLIKDINFISTKYNTRKINVYLEINPNNLT